MGRTSKDLLSFEHKNLSAASTIESTLLVCKKDCAQDGKPNLDKKPVTAPVPQSQVLGKVKDFLGVISEANRSLELNAQDKSVDYDIEALTGNESEIIEMDLMLGIADLHNPDAVAAAESAISGNQPVITLPDSSETESDDSSSEDDSDNDDDDEKTCFPDERKKIDSIENEVNETMGKKKSKKRPRIVELS
ncbi:hypothetical protein HS088_TW08G00555 [Tripterygium wilfordii]|uniref:Uncharacterized protein n=1 Tax=Tripterygium wilfordii TaxID=458696 RepID=A0A7J7DC94_TRIWF|nr:uncharacterized protein LOC120004132 [Tripterygium wilfordii]KAF5743967.1 hypothetical protein HS088_TW08G00555 [Tripterygium wilfordii]